MGIIADIMAVMSSHLQVLSAGASRKDVEYTSSRLFLAEI